MKPTEALDSISDWVVITRQMALQTLRSTGLIDQSAEELVPMEGAVQDAFSPISPPDGFRENLRENLLLAAQQRSSGLAIEYPTPFREGIILGISAGILAALVAALVLVLRSRMPNTAH
jgi:hypothetical protein